MSYYGEEFGETYKTVGVPALRRLLSSLRREQRKEEAKALEAKMQIASEVRSAYAVGIRFSADMLAECLKREAR